MTHHRYLAAIVDGGGNVPPELGAVRRLVERGHTVTVLAEDSVAAEVHATGATLRRWVRAPNRPDRRPENDPCRDWECKYPWQLLDRLVGAVFIGPGARYAGDVTDAIADTRPQLVMCSMFCMGGMVAAEAAGIPFDVMFPNIYLLPASGMPPFGIGLMPARGTAGRWRDRILSGAIERLWDSKGLAGLNELRRQHGLAPVTRFLDQIRRAPRQRVMTSHDFDFPADLPAGARYVGPILDDPSWAEAALWRPPDGSHPLVLVAMSSTFQDQLGCLRRVVEALGKSPVRAIVTTGPAIDGGTLQAPANVSVVSSAPHGQVLEHAALVVTHGGHGTVMKALAAGVPLVILPHGRDQPDTAARVAARGAGVTLKRTATSTAIADAIRRVLEDPSYRSAARRLGETIRGDAGGGALLRELEDISNGGEKWTEVATLHQVSVPGRR